MNVKYIMGSRFFLFSNQIKRPTAKKSLSRFWVIHSTGVLVFMCLWYQTYKTDQKQTGVTML